MIDDEMQARIAAAEWYEREFVPAEFQEWAARTLAAARVRPGDRLLDVACGTGIVAREAARIVGPAGRVAGVDRDAAMLAVARRVAPSIDWKESDGASIPAADASFDAVTCQFGLMFFADRPQGLREMRRVLAPGGRLAVAVWDTLARTPAYGLIVGLLDTIAGSAEAAAALRAPFALGDRGELAALFAEAGMADAVIATHDGRGRFASVRAMVEAELRGWMPVVGVSLSDEEVHRLVRDAEARFAGSGFVGADGAVDFASPAHIVSWTRP